MIDTKICNGGIKLVSQQIKWADSVTVGLWIPRGSFHEKSFEEYGAHHFIEHMLFKGTTTKSAEDITRTIESSGGTVNAFTGNEYTCYHITILKQYCSLALDILLDMYFNSTFPEDEFEKEKNVVLEEIKRRKDDPGIFVQDSAIMSNYDGVCGHRVVGTNESIRIMSRKFLLEFYKHSYKSEEMIVSFVGNLPADEVQDIIETSCNKLTFKDHRSSISSAEGAFIPQVKVLTRDVEQTYLVMLSQGVSFINEDRPTLWLIDAILGTGMSSKLFLEIRECLGLVYTIYSFAWEFKSFGMFGIQAQTGKDRFEQTISKTVNVLNKLAIEGVSDIDIDRAKTMMVSQILMGDEKLYSLFYQLGEGAVLGKNFESGELVDLVERVTPKMISEMLKQIARPKKFGVTVMGSYDDKEAEKLAGVVENIIGG